MSLILSNELKTSLIAITSIILTAGVGAVILAVARQDEYAPFKAKQLNAVMLSLVTACLWSLGSLQSTPVFDLTSPVWSNCNFWQIWYAEL